LGEINDSFSTEDLKCCDKEPLEAPVFPKKFLEKIWHQTLLKWVKIHILHI
jgi:hypothetical protein